MDLFDKHLKTGFDLGWHRDIPRFTEEDWHKYFKLAFELWQLEMRCVDAHNARWIDDYNSLSLCFSQYYQGNPIDQVRACLKNMVSPIGPIEFYGESYSVYLLRDTLENATEKKWDDETKKKFFAALAKIPDPRAQSRENILDPLEYLETPYGPVPTSEFF